MAGVGVGSPQEALQVALLAAALAGAAHGVRWFVQALQFALAAAREGKRAARLPAWPPPAFREAFGGGFGYRTGGLLTWRCPDMPTAAAAGSPCRGRRQAAGFGWGLLAGMALGAFVLDLRVAALQQLQLPRLVWVGGYASGPWTAGAWSARVRLVAPRTNPDRCPLPGQGPLVPGAVEVEASPRLARARPMTAGRWVCVRGLLRIPGEAPVPGAFSPRRYLNARGVLTYLEVRAADRLVVLEVPGARPPLSLRLRAQAMEQARAAARRVAALAGERGGAWFRAIALGEADALDDPRRAALQASGLGHLTSVSGMHVGLLAGPMVLAARRLRGRAFQGAAVAAAALGGWMYAAATGMESPSVRALLVQAGVLAASLAGRRPGLGPALGWAAAVQLVHNPYLAQDAGFQLSYAATAGIAAVMAGRRHGLRLPMPEPTPPGVGTRGAWKNGILAVMGRMAGWAARGWHSLAISAGAWAASAPVAGYHFGWVSPWGVLTSAASGFPALVLLWSGILAWLLPLPLARMAGWLTQAAAGLLEGIARMGSESAQRWPVLVPRAAWLAFGAVLLIGIRRAGGVVGSRGLLLAAGLAGLVTWRGAWLSDGSPRLMGQPLGGSGWLLVGGSGDGPAWAVVSAGSGRLAPVLRWRLAAVMGAAGIHRLGLVVTSGHRAAHTEVVDAMGPPAASALALSLQDGGFAVEGGLIGRSQAVRQVTVGRVTLRPAAFDEGEGDGPGLEVGVPGLDPLRVDRRGCLKLGGREGTLCASLRPVAVRAGPGGWEELR